MSRMRIIKKTLITASLLSLSVLANAGNDQKRGSAGATEVLMNPWARSGGYAGANIAGIRGIESMRFNVAGISDTAGLSIGYAHTLFMYGSGVASNAVGYTQSVGKRGTLGVSLMMMDLGDFDETTADQPDGTGIAFSPTYFNMGVAYSQRFSESIKGGLLVRLVSQSIRNARSTGVGVDAGIQYNPKDFDRFHFGVSLRSVGTSMQFTGDGLSGRGVINDGNQYTQTLNQRTATFEMPTTLYIGASYDFLTDADGIHQLSGMAAFQSMSYSNDRFLIGGEYTLNNLVSFRLGFDYYPGLFSSDFFENTDVNGGPTGGLSVKKAYGSGDITRQMIIDYSYRHTSFFGGTHSLGLSFDI